MKSGIGPGERTSPDFFEARIDCHRGSGSYADWNTRVTCTHQPG